MANMSDTKDSSGKLKADGRSKYLDISHKPLSQLNVPDSVHCTNVNSCDASHLNDTSAFYNEIMGSLIQASDTVFSLPLANKKHIKPG